MRYDTLIIGSGYTALGYASEIGNTLICEERELCDTSFCMPLASFGKWEYRPVTEKGRALASYFESKGLLVDGYPNTNALEGGFCGFALERGIEIFLKCRVLGVTPIEDGGFDARIISGGGIEHVIADRVIDMRGKDGDRSLTVLFTANNPESDIKIISGVFPDGSVEPAFYSGRYALHVPVSHCDLIRAKKELYDRWSSVTHTAQLLYTAPAFALKTRTNEGIPVDSAHREPIAAFESGIAYARALKGGAV